MIILLQLIRDQDITTSTIDRIDGNDVYLKPVDNKYHVNFSIPFSKSCLENIENQNIDGKIKVNLKDNTITIKSVKNSWNREEFISCIKSYCDTRDRKSLSEWIKENL